jgi:hypothetical protein
MKAYVAQLWLKLPLLYPRHNHIFSAAICILVFKSSYTYIVVLNTIYMVVGFCNIKLPTKDMNLSRHRFLRSVIWGGRLAKSTGLRTSVACLFLLSILEVELTYCAVNTDVPELSLLSNGPTSSLMDLLLVQKLQKRKAKNLKHYHDASFHS